MIRWSGVYIPVDLVASMCYACCCFELTGNRFWFVCHCFREFFLSYITYVLLLRNKKIETERFDTFDIAFPRSGWASLTGWSFLGSLLFSWSSCCILIATQDCWLPAWTCCETRGSTSPPIDNQEELIDFSEATSLVTGHVLEESWWAIIASSCDPILYIVLPDQHRNEPHARNCTLSRILGLSVISY